MKIRKLAKVENKYCVACGTCILVCPRNAIQIPNGIVAKISEELCVGCGKCKIACPASIIELVKVEQEVVS